MSLLCSPNLDDHYFEQLKKVLGRLQNARLKLKPIKCKLIEEKVTLKIGPKDDINPNLNIDDPVKNRKTQKNVNEVLYFLELCN